MHGRERTRCSPSIRPGQIVNAVQAFVDTADPQLGTAPDITVAATGPAGARVDYPLPPAIRQRRPRSGRDVHAGSRHDVPGRPDDGLVHRD